MVAPQRWKWIASFANLTKHDACQFYFLLFSGSYGALEEFITHQRTLLAHS